jgi:hypothetical protein
MDKYSYTTPSIQSHLVVEVEERSLSAHAHIFSRLLVIGDLCTEHVSVAHSKVLSRCLREERSWLCPVALSVSFATPLID